MGYHETRNETEVSLLGSLRDGVSEGKEVIGDGHAHGGGEGGGGDGAERHALGLYPMARGIVPSRERTRRRGENERARVCVHGGESCVELLTNIPS